MFVDGDWLEDIYKEKADLFPGRVVELPWSGKLWKAVIKSTPEGILNII